MAGGVKWLIQTNSRESTNTHPIVPAALGADGHSHFPELFAADEPSRMLASRRDQHHAIVVSLHRRMRPSALLNAPPEAQVLAELDWTATATELLRHEDPDDGINTNCYNSRDIFPGAKVNSLRLSYGN